MKSRFKFTRSLSAIYWFLSIVFGLMPFVILIIAVVKYGVDIPYIDQWDFIPLLERSYQGTLAVTDLLAQQNEHRLFFPFIIQIVLARLTGWNIFYELAAIILFAAGIYFALIYQMKKTSGSVEGLNVLWMILPVSLIIFSLSQWESWSMGGQIAVFLNVFAVLVGIILLADPIFKWSRFYFALFMGIVATYSFANGLCYWLIGIMILLLIRPKDKRTAKKTLFIWAAAGIAVTFLYFQGFHRSPDSLPLFNVFERPLVYVDYVVNMLGGPIVNYNEKYAFSAGLFGLIFFVHLGWQLIRSGSIKYRSLVPYISFGLYSIMSALMSGIGRAGFGSDYALASRYVTFSSLLWVANVFYLYLFAGGIVMTGVGGDSRKNKNDLKKRSLKVRYGPLLVLAFILMMLIVNSVYGARYFDARYQYLAAARDELLSSGNDSFMILLNPNAATVKERLPVLKKYHLSLFRNAAKEGNDSLAKVMKRTKKDMAGNPLLDGVYNHLGTLYFKQGKYAEAKYLWTKTLEINPNYINAYLNLAVYCYNEKDYVLARQYVLEAQKRGATVDPEFLKALNMKP